MRHVLRAAATAAGIFAASPSLAVIVDGIVGAGEYGAPTGVVTTDPAAPTSNFETPGSSAAAGYNIYLKDVGDTLFGAVQQTGGTIVGPFVNLYFDLNPSLGGSPVVSELVIEVTNKKAFIGGFEYNIAPAINFTSLTTGGLVTTEFSIDESVFRSAIGGLLAAGYLNAGNYNAAEDVRLNLSQSLSYSVTGGNARFERLGRFSVAASDVPEPASWAMMLAGFGGIGFAMRRRKTSTSIAFG